MASAAAQTQAESVRRAGKICVVMLLLPVDGHHARIDRKTKIGK
jgi:hypothetical protein